VIRQATNSPIHQLRSLQEFRNLRAFAELHIGFLPVRSAARETPLPLDLAVRDGRPDALDLRPEQLLHGVLDLNLVRAARHLEHNRPAVFAQDRRLLRDERPADHVSQLHMSPEIAEFRMPISDWIADWRI